MKDRIIQIIVDNEDNLLGLSQSGRLYLYDNSRVDNKWRVEEQSPTMRYIAPEEVNHDK